MPGWPFAFRAPAGWQCTRRSGQQVNLPDSQQYVCRPTARADAGEYAVVMVRACPGTCSRAEADRMNDVWFRPTDRLLPAGGSARFVEDTPDGSGKYGIYLTGFISWNGSGGGATYRQVAVGAVAPMQGRDNGVSATIALGHAAGADYASGRMSATQAAASLRHSILRLYRAGPTVT